MQPKEVFKKVWRNVQVIWNHSQSHKWPEKKQIDIKRTFHDDNSVIIQSEKGLVQRPAVVTGYFEVAFEFLFLWWH